MDNKNKDFPDWEKNYDLLFKAPEEKSKKIDAQLQAAMKDMTFYTSGMPQKLGDYYDNIVLLGTISNFTREDISHNQKLGELINLKILGLIQNYELGNDRLTINDKYGHNFTVQKMSDFIVPREASDMTSTKRFKKCHTGSFEAMMMLKKLNTSKMVTGYVYGLTKDSKYLHSWVELNLKGKPVVCDYVFNAIMDKEAYYRVRHVNPDELTIITQAEFNDDVALVKDLINKGVLSIKQYAVFRHEIMRDLNKNASVYKE